MRAILGLYNAVGLIYFRRCVTASFGRSAGVWFAILQASQFHVLFYASRTLPNSFAFGLSKSLYCRALAVALDYKILRWII